MNSTHYKVCLVGPTQVGKTRVLRKCLGVYTPTYSYIPTLGVEVFPIHINAQTRRNAIINTNNISGLYNTSYTPGIQVIPVQLQPGRTITINIWDLAGDPRYKGLGKGYLVKADLCVIYDPTYNPNTTNLWVQSAQRMQVPYVIVGNDIQAINAIHNNNFV